VCVGQSVDYLIILSIFYIFFKTNFFVRKVLVKLLKGIVTTK